MKTTSAAVNSPRVLTVIVSSIRSELPARYWLAYLTIAGISILSAQCLLLLTRHHPVPSGPGASVPFVTFSIAIVFLIAVIRPLWLVIRRHPAPTRQLIEDAWRNRGWLATIALMAIALPQTLEAATRFKWLIPRVVPYYADGTIASFEHRLLGVDAWRVTHALIGPHGTRAIDLAYACWHPLNIALLCWLVLTRNRRFQVQAVLTYQLTWLVLGGAVAMAFASVGPCFVQDFTGNTRFAPLMTQLRAVNGPTGLYSLSAMRYLVESQHRDVIGCGISAMHSLHVAIAVFAVLTVFRETGRIWLRCAVILYLAIIYVGSIHLGWHYASDGIVGGIGVAAIWRAVGWFSDRTIGDPTTEPIVGNSPAAGVGTV